jgi:hypothetical protein
MTPEEALRVLDKNSYAFASVFTGSKRIAIFTETFAAIEVFREVLGMEPIKQTVEEAYDQYCSVIGRPDCRTSKGESPRYALGYLRV